MASIQERIITYRTINNMSQREFARRCGVCQSTIEHLETEPGRPMSKTTLRKIEFVLMGGRIKPKKED